MTDAISTWQAAPITVSEEHQGHAFLKTLEAAFATHSLGARGTVHGKGQPA